MALVNCPNCGKENVSDDAVRCPGCKYNVREHFYLLERDAKRKSFRTNYENELKEHGVTIKQKTIERLETERSDKVPSAVLFGGLTLLFFFAAGLGIIKGKEILFLIIFLFFGVVCAVNSYSRLSTIIIKTKNIKIAKKDMSDYFDKYLKATEASVDKSHLPFENDNIQFYCKDCGKGIAYNNNGRCPECGKQLYDEKNEYQNRIKNKVFLHECPKCGSYRVGSKMIKESKKVGSLYQCNDCNYTWKTI